MMAIVVKSVFLSKDIGMFSVSCTGSTNGRKLIANGVVIGDEGHSLLFEVSVPDIDAPLTVEFRLVDGSDKSPATTEVGEIEDNKVVVNFHNCTRNGPSGMGVPLSVVAFQGTDLQLVFHIERNSGAPTYLMVYSFYECPVGWGY
ncbi:hypothetical protein OO306_00625 [Pseudomonas sp. DCB_AW]|uniref:DUF6864 domain-containing function n=1 Tax=Pseudomonas sp. DCB_AW TaxID=2993596 RepID=UPI0022496B86|nr:hypothetical protein [Pseudomonas sp. DCB_AW]MCX2684050.1 hypothetical protein [Pseudomonas sp. DCB_AW]